MNSDENGNGNGNIAWEWKSENPFLQTSAKRTKLQLKHSSSLLMAKHKRLHGVHLHGLQWELDIPPGHSPSLSLSKRRNNLLPVA